VITDLINLDDLTYAALVAEARASIPSLTPAWTDHNESDPGIVLVELFAWLTEILLYRFNHVSDESYWTFLRLLNDPTWHPGDQSLEQAIDATVRLLRDRERAINGADYQHFILEKWPVVSPPATPGDQLARIRFLPETRRAPTPGPDLPAPAHVSVALLNAVPPTFAPPPDSGLWQALAAYLDDRRMLTTKVHLAPPRRIQLSVKGDVYLTADADLPTVTQVCSTVLNDFVDPITGGRDRRGWPFGQDLYLSEIYAQLMQVAGVAYVDGVALDVVTPPYLGPSRRFPGGIDVADCEVIALEPIALVFHPRDGSL